MQAHWAFPRSLKCTKKEKDIIVITISSRSVFEGHVHKLIIRRLLLETPGNMFSSYFLHPSITQLPIISNDKKVWKLKQVNQATSPIGWIIKHFMHIIFVTDFLRPYRKGQKNVRKKNEKLKFQKKNAVITCLLDVQLPHRGSVCMYKAGCSRGQLAYSSSCSVCNQILVWEDLDKMDVDLEFLPRYLTRLLLNELLVVQ